MKIIISALTPSFAKALENYCTDLKDVEIHTGSILDVKCDAIVSPANSFGFMDGGIDAQYIGKFGGHVQDKVRWNILTKHYGELLVGEAAIVETGCPQSPYLIAAPTMRVPMVLPENTINPYLAVRAVLLLVREGVFQAGDHAGERIGDVVNTVAFPGMGTGVGRVSGELCARQFCKAISHFRNEDYSLPKSWAEASEDHQFLYSDTVNKLQY